jgi:hypothetical protein
VAKPGTAGLALVTISKSRHALGGWGRNDETVGALSGDAWQQSAMQPLPGVRALIVPKKAGSINRWREGG